MKSIFIALLFASISASASTMDNAMAKVHGTCTSETCPPGTVVINDAVPGDTGIARTPDGKIYDLLSLKGIEFTVLEKSGAENHKAEAMVTTGNGSVYLIQWLFLKKK